VDTTDHPSLGRLSHLNAQLATQNRRIEALVSAQLDHVERLFRAATRHDWTAVEQASRELAKQPAEGENAAVVRAATQVCDALRLDASGAKATRPLAKLIDACRMVKTKRRA
jgi:cobalamin biosynthesis Mg chelatase CobN